MLPLLDDEQVSVEVLADDEPAFAAAVAPAPDAKAPPLAQGVVHEPVVAADLLPVLVHHVPGTGRQICHQKPLEVPLPDEADAGGILLLGHGQGVLSGQVTDLPLLYGADGKHGPGELFLGEACQEVGLVLHLIQPFQKADAALIPGQPGVVARSQSVCAGLHGEVQKGFELDLRVAEHVRVGGPSGGILRQEVGEDPVLILLGKVDRVVGDVQGFADPAHVLVVLLRRAGAVHILPIAHEDARDFKALLLQQQSRHGAVNAPRQAHDDALVVPLKLHIKRPSCGM